MKKPTLLTSLISLCLLASCSMLMPPLMGGLGAGAGAAVAGPGGAIEEKAPGHDKELAQYMIQIERRLPLVAT